MKRSTTLISVIVILLITIGVIWFSGIFSQNIERPIQYVQARVLRVTSQALTPDPLVPGLYIGSQQLEVEILTGAFKGRQYQVKNDLGRLYNVYAKKDMKFIMALQLENGTLKNLSVYNYKRDTTIYIMTALFFIILTAVGGIKGLKSIISLIFTGVLVIFLMVPLIYRGFDPVFTAVLIAMLTTSVSMYLIGGWNKKTLSAVLGIVIGVIIAGIISYISGKIAHLSGLTMEQAEELLQIASNTKMNVRGLMFASILIASLGAIMDIGISIASSVFEMHSIDPKLGKKALFKSAMNVGRDIMGTMSNTLILAFTGGALNTMLIILAYKMPYIQVVNLDLIGTEVIQSIAGSIGIILTVPLTALIAVLLITKREGITVEANGK